MDVSYWITGIVTLLVGIFGSTGFWTWINSRREKNSEIYKYIENIEKNVNEHMERMEKGFLGLEYLGIKMSCKTILDRGWVDIEELEDIEKLMYKPYVSMGGNGIAKELFEEVKQLPHKPKGE